MLDNKTKFVIELILFEQLNIITCKGPYPINLESKQKYKQDNNPMHLNVQSKSESNKISFFQKSLTPSQYLMPLLSSQIDNDPIYFMAKQVRSKLIKGQRKPVNLERKNQSCLLKRQETRFQNQDTDVSHNLTLSPYCKTRNTNEKLNIAFVDQRKLLSKVSMHRIRSQRQDFLGETIKLQNSHNYLLHKIQKTKQKSFQIKLKQSRIKQFQDSHKKLKLNLEHQKHQYLQEISLQKIRLRQSVIRQKGKRERAFTNFYSSRVIKAKEVKQQSIKIKEQILKSKLEELKTKKGKYVTQKQNQKKRASKHQENLSNIKLQAQCQFRQKWLDQFDKTSRARQLYIKRKNVLGKKMQNLLGQLKNQQCRGEHFNSNQNYSV